MNKSNQQPGLPSVERLAWLTIGVCVAALVVAFWAVAASVLLLVAAAG